MKQSIRSQVLRKRDSLLEEEIKTASQQIVEQIQKLKEYKKAKVVALYQPIKNEVNLLSLKGKSFAFPKVFGEDIKFFNDKEFKQGAFNVMEPIGENFVDKNDIDIIFVPLVAIDKANNRIGYGKGYYDRYLQDYKGLKIGVGYSFQVVENIDCSKYDVPLDILILGDIK